MLASFVPETITILALFMFCSNLNKFPVLLEIFNFMFSINVMENPLKFFALYRRFLIPFYVVGVVAILYCYYLMIFKIRFSVRRKWVNLFLILIVSSCLTAFWQLNYRSFVERNFLSVQSRVIKKNNETPNVFLIIMDTVRADRLAVYGHPSNGKNLLEISKDFLVFENCISSSSWTQPSHASLFTGLYPVEHGTHKNLASSSAFLTTTSLSEEFTTLAEVFKNNGYQTLGVVSNWPNLSSELKFNKGFQVYDCSQGIGWITSYNFKPIFNFFCYITNTKPKYTLPYRTAEDINANIFHLINNPEPLPFFMFINYMDAHEPHRPPRPFSHRRFSPQVDKIIAYTPFSDENDETFDESFSLRQYDSEICYMDHHLGKLFSQLKKQGIYDSSLIIISSDHGELFGEHGQKGHGVQTKNIHLYEGVVRVPLLIKFPQSQKVVQKQNRIILSDLYLKILTICGLPVPDHISAQSRPHHQSTVVSEFYDDGIGAHRALYDEKYKYMHYTKKKPELYDLERDPGEQENLAESLPEITTLMENKLIIWQKEHMPKYSNTPSADSSSSEEVMEGLKSLGYIE